jgi:hypothetical protein
LKLLGTDLTRDINRDMFDYMPKDYEELAESSAIVTAEASEFETLNADVADVLDQFFVDTATWGLDMWESICGIATDISKPYDQRRSVIKSKLRGYGTVTTAFVQSVAESYANGDVDVIEDPANYTITVKFVSEIGVPPNLPDIEQALRDIIPAHLAVDFAFKYYTVTDVQAMTISDINTKILNDFSPFGADSSV